MTTAIETVAFCDLCESLTGAGNIGDPCAECKEGFYEEHLEQSCPIGESCTDELHHFGYGTHIGRPEDFDKEV